MKDRAFTLIELLVVISIIGILISISLFGIGNARKSSRDAKRKSDLETIRSALEMYKADVGGYPANAPDPGHPLQYQDNEYLASWPEDPLPARSYAYYSNQVTYTVCAALETDTRLEAKCTDMNCGEDVTCSYAVENP